MTMAPVNETASETASETANETVRGAAQKQRAGLPRLLPLVPGLPEDLRTYLARYGRPPYRGGPGMLIGSVV